VIRSFEEARLEQLIAAHVPALAEPGAPVFEPRELAELVWLICHQNILDFLAGVPAHRQHRLRFEDLVSQPHATVGALCEFLGLELEPKMLEPYEDQQRRMTDGVHAVGRMLGDVKFHRHKRIDPAVADKWREHYEADFLGDDTWSVAEALGYDASDRIGEARRPGVVERLRAGKSDELLAEIDQLSDAEVDSLLSEMSAKQRDQRQR
jgi:hypothetical protein